MAVMDWGGANSRFLGLVSVWAARSFDQTALRPSVIKRIRQIDVKYITHITTCMCELPRCTVHWTRISSIHWILDFKQLLLLYKYCILLLLLLVLWFHLLYYCNRHLRSSLGWTVYLPWQRHVSLVNINNLMILKDPLGKRFGLINSLN